METSQESSWILLKNPLPYTMGSQATSRLEATNRKSLGTTDITKATPDRPSSSGPGQFSTLEPGPQIATLGTAGLPPAPPWPCPPHPQMPHFGVILMKGWTGGPKIGCCHSTPLPCCLISTPQVQCWGRIWPPENRGRTATATKPNKHRPSAELATWSMGQTAKFSLSSPGDMVVAL